MASLIISFVFLYTLCSLGNAIGIAAEESTKDFQFHTVQPSSLLPSSTCIRSTYAGLKEGTVLEVVHKQGPCSPLNQQGKPSSFSPAEVLKHDKARVDFLHQKSNGLSNASLPSTNLYVVTVGLGMPEKKVPLSFDTGSDFTWTQCEPCSRHCFNQSSSIFDPTVSSTYSTFNCSSPSCLPNNTGYLPFCNSTRCMYQVRYGDGSYSIGLLSKESLTLTPTDVVDDFIFGCGENNTGSFRAYESGVLGLGHRPVSIVQQTANKFQKIFSYCIPSKPSYTGFLRFGAGVQNSFVFTPLSKNVNSTEYYGIDILGINLGGKKLPIPTAVFANRGAIIDSGATITSLPPAAYKVLRDAYRQALSHYKNVDPKDISVQKWFDTCHSRGISDPLNLPKASFLFGGGAVVDLAPLGLIFPINSTVFCLAFSERSPSATLGTIIGIFQQKTLEVMYDVDKGRIGFAPAACN